MVALHRPSIACSTSCMASTLFLNCFSVLDAKLNVQINKLNNTL